MVLLTHLLMRAMSLHAFALRTTSRGASGLVSHSGAYSEQNSSQPIGGRTLPPTVRKGCRSPARLADDVATPATSVFAASPAASISIGLHFIGVAPRFFSR